MNQPAAHPDNKQGGAAAGKAPAPLAGGISHFLAMALEGRIGSEKSFVSHR